MTIRFCPNCGKPVSAGNNFCVGCGCQLTQPEPQPAYNQQPAQQPTPAYVAPQPVYTDLGKKLGIASVALGAAAIFLSLLWLCGIGNIITTILIPLCGVAGIVTNVISRKNGGWSHIKLGLILSIVGTAGLIVVLIFIYSIGMGMVHYNAIY